MQMFRRPVSMAVQGDRVGVCVTQFDPKLLERGVVCSPGSLHTLYAALIAVHKISYFRGTLASRTKFHISLGHETVMARVSFFGSAAACGSQSGAEPDPESQPVNEAEAGFSFDREYRHQEEYVIGQSEGKAPEQWALLEFEKPVTCPPNCLVIGSRLDTDIHANTCRLAFHGRLLHGMEEKNYAESTLPRLLISKDKQREGAVERVHTHTHTHKVAAPSE